MPALTASHTTSEIASVMPMVPSAPMIRPPSAPLVNQENASTPHAWNSVTPATPAMAMVSTA